jgi:hypothetical protein
MEGQEFEVRDLRDKGQFTTDDKFLNGYARFLEIYSVGVYGSLCRHSNKYQRCFPSVRKICEELSIGKDSAINAIKRLEFWKIIKKHRIGKMANNRYDLINKKYWIPISEDNLRRYSDVCHTDFNTLLHRLHLSATQTSNSKDTQSKDTQIRESLKKGYYKGERITIKSDGSYWIVRNGGDWFSFAGNKKDIIWE